MLLKEITLDIMGRRMEDMKKEQMPTHAKNGILQMLTNQIWLCSHCKNEVCLKCDRIRSMLSSVERLVNRTGYLEIVAQKKKWPHLGD